MVAALAASLAGMWLDPRTIGGAPAWLKPAKFAASIAIYSLTLAWVFTYLPAWVSAPAGWSVERPPPCSSWKSSSSTPRRGAARRATSTSARRSTPSSFRIMGLAIVLQTLTSVAVAVALWRQTFADRALGWALRLGMAITIVGAASGGLMTQPTERAVDRGARNRPHDARRSAHGRGARRRAWLAGNRLERGARRPSRAALPRSSRAAGTAAHAARASAAGAGPTRDAFAPSIAAAASYVSLFGILLWQALRGQSVINPDAAMVTALAAWLITDDRWPSGWPPRAASRSART